MAERDYLVTVETRTIDRLRVSARSEAEAAMNVGLLLAGTEWRMDAGDRLVSTDSAVHRVTVGRMDAPEPDDGDGPPMLGLEPDDRRNLRR